MTTRSTTCSPEVRARAVRMVFEHCREHASEWTAITSIATEIGCNAETRRLWVRQAQRDQGLWDGTTTDAETTALADLIARRRQIIQMITAEGQREKRHRSG